MIMYYIKEKIHSQCTHQQWLVAETSEVQTQISAGLAYCIIDFSYKHILDYFFPSHYAKSNLDEEARRGKGKEAISYKWLFM